MKEHLKLFAQNLKTDLTLQQKLNETLGQSEDRLEAIVMIGRQAGYEFSVEELQEHLGETAGSRELDDSELEQIAGGLEAIRIPPNLYF